MPINNYCNKASQAANTLAPLTSSSAPLYRANPMSETKKRTRQKKKPTELSRKNILAAAEKVFVTKGFSAARLDDVATLAKVSKGLIFYHFGSKRNLWHEVKMRYYRDYVDSQTQNINEMTKDPLATLKDGIKIKFDFLQNSPNYSRLSSWILAEQDMSGENLRAELQKLGIDFLKQAQEKGAIRHDIDAENIYFMYICLVDSWFQTRFRYQPQDGNKKQLQEFDKAFLTDMMKVYLDGLTCKTSQHPR